MSPSYYTCTCPYGYQGNGIGPSGCIQISGGGGGSYGNPCAPNPCLNSGHCAPHMGTFTCTCVQGYTGRKTAKLLKKFLILSILKCI